MWSGEGSQQFVWEQFRANAGDIDVELLRKGEYTAFAVQVDSGELKQAAASGCSSCSLLEAVIVKFSGDVFPFDDNLVVNLVFCRGAALRLTVYRAEKEDDNGSDFDGRSFSSIVSIGGLDLKDLGEGLEWIELYTLPGQSCPWPTTGSSMRLERPEGNLPTLSGGLARHVPANPNSDDCFHIIREWIDTCTRTHALCRDADARADRQPWLPKRMISVGGHDNSQIRLVEDVQVAPGEDVPKYAALSHCWGQSQHLILSKSTRDERTRNIAWNTFPRTFQDAILIARRLGYQFLWIDSLCIIQDDAEDWAAEAATMASVYGRAHLVIAATASADGDGGCFAERDDFIEIRGSFNGERPFGMFARRTRKHDAFGRADDPFNAHRLDSLHGQLRIDFFLDNYPLLARAWCFQERLLATRILHFARDEIFFDCLDGVSCECGALDGFGDDPLRLPRHLVKLEQPYHLKLSIDVLECEYVPLSPDSYALCLVQM